MFNDKTQTPEPDRWTSPYEVVFMDLEMPGERLQFQLCSARDSGPADGMCQ
jgi:hypothetical protein